MKEILKKLQSFYSFCTVVACLIAIVLIKDLINLRKEMENFPWMKKTPLIHLFYMLLSTGIVSTVKILLSRFSEGFLYGRIEKILRNHYGRRKNQKLFIFLFQQFPTQLLVHSAFISFGEIKQSQKSSSGVEGFQKVTT